MIDPTTLPETEAVTEAARALEHAPPEEILAWAIGRYRGRIALACSFGGATGIVALDMAMKIDRATPVYYLDTGLLFAQTHALIQRIRERYAIEPIAVEPRLPLDEQATLHGQALWTSNPDLCCRLRKIEPQRAFLRNYDAWISGLRRDQTDSRRTAPAVSWDAQFDSVKVNPFARWSEEMVWTYVRAQGLPYNELHDARYPSVGCVPCTRAIRPGEGLRDGRWAGSGKVECGLHLTPAVRGTTP